jgi:hypothetical protein
LPLIQNAYSSRAKHEATEFLFESGDRADIVLIDKSLGYVGVEIEVTQDRDQLEGILQAVKYRHLLAVAHRVSFRACRSLLVAYDIHPAIQKLCKRYKVAYREVDRKQVKDWDTATRFEARASRG